MPYVAPGTLTIEEAYIQFQAGNGGASSTLEIRIWSSGNFQGNYITTYTGITNSYTYRRAQCYEDYVTWTPPYRYTGHTYNSTDVSLLLQEWSDGHNWLNLGMICFFNDLSGTDNGQMYWYPWPAREGRLFIRWSQYTASWYPLPPLSLASLPITLDVVALAALTGAVALAWRENRRKMS